MNSKQIFIKQNGVLKRIKFEEIYYLEAMGDYVHIYVIDRRYTFHATLGDFTACLPDDMFVRTHRSFTINFIKAESVEGNIIYLDDKRYIPIGDYYRKQVFRCLNVYNWATIEASFMAKQLEPPKTKQPIMIAQTIEPTEPDPELKWTMPEPSTDKSVEGTLKQNLEQLKSIDDFIFIANDNLPSQYNRIAVASNYYGNQWGVKFRVEKANNGIKVILKKKNPVHES